MIEIDKSWEFLREFYQSDPSIVKLINRTVAFSADISIRGDNFENLMEDILALLPIQAKTYHDFLDYVKAYRGIEDEEIKEEINNSAEDTQINISSKENLFLNSWIDEMLGKSNIFPWMMTMFAMRLNKRSVKNFSKSIKIVESNIIEFQKTLSSMPYSKPYLLLDTLGISENWFLYDRGSGYFKHDEQFEEICRLSFRLLRKQKQSKIQNIRKKSIKAKQSKTTGLSPWNLYPIMTLLIILRWEWEFANDGTYISKKSYILKKSSEISVDKQIDSLLYGLYREFEFREQSIVNDFDPNVSPIRFHPYVAKRIIESQRYKSLYREINEHTVESADWFEYIEKRYISDIEKKKNGKHNNKRLLLDYMFPYTIVRNHDVFNPTGSETEITDRIYLSLERGKDYEKIWRNPKDNEQFDYIQLLKPMSSSTDDTRVIGYQNYLAPNGRYLVVKSQAEYESEDKIESAFSDFRHDLKILMSGTHILTLQMILDSIDESNIKINKLINQVESFIHHTEDVELLKSLMSSIQDLENDCSLRTKIPNSGKIENTIRDIQSVIECSDDTISQESVSSLTILSLKLKQQWAEICIETVAKQKGRIDNIKETHNLLCSYIKMAGALGHTNTNKERFKIVDFLKSYQQFIELNTGGISVNIDDTAIKQGYTIDYNKAILHIILDSIVDNANEHGFKDYECKSPTIEFVLMDTEQYLILKVCNNGRPINITNEGFKASGVFAGPTGHTGLGGYQISKYAESQGGFVQLPKDKIWNTEIHLYIKK